METARFLADELGPRPAGSDADHRACEYLAARLGKLGLAVELRRFSFRGWRALGEGTVRVEDGAGSAFAAVGFPYTFATQPPGQAGLLRWQGEWPLLPGRIWSGRFILEENGAPVAAVLVDPVGGARPLPNAHALLAMPTVVVDAADGARLREIVLESGGGIRAQVISPPVWEGLLGSANIVAGLGGADTRRTLLLVAHYDCVEGSPGANDNASGAALLLRLARRFRDDRDKPLSIRFLFCSAEEPFLVGSRTYAHELAATGALAGVAGCLNFDMVAVGDRFAVRRVTDSPWERAAAAAPVSPAGRPVTQTDLFASSDHWAFHELGVPSAQLTREPDREWHGHDDTIDRYGDADLIDVEEVAASLVEAACTTLAKEDRGQPRM